MLSTHIFLVILVTVILIVFAEHQKLRKITWMLFISCITYILLIVIPEKPLPINNEYNELNKIDSSNVTMVTNYQIKNDTVELGFSSKVQNLETLTIAIATDIIDRTPIGVSRLFLNEIDKLFCFTAVDNPSINNKIIHTWKFDGQDYFKNSIKVGKAPYWRCWSRITIRPEMVGDWQVVVTDTIGNYLDSIEFSIIPASE